MTGTDAVDYLGLEQYRGWTGRDANLAIIEFAQDRGFYTGVWDGIPVEFAQAQAAGLDGYGDYFEGIDDELERIATDAIEYMTDAGILPQGYGLRTPVITDGYGLLPEDGEGS